MHAAQLTFAGTVSSHDRTLCAFRSAPVAFVRDLRGVLSRERVLQALRRNRMMSKGGCLMGATCLGRCALLRRCP